MSKIYSLDTNIILDDPSNLVALYEEGSNEIIIPEVVFDELDAKKSGFEDINYNARQFARMLEESEIINKEETDGLQIITTKIDSLNIELKILSVQSYDCEDQSVAINILNDRKILEATQKYQKYIADENLIFLSIDIMCRTRALTLGIKTETLKGKDQTKEFEFHKEIIVPNVKAQLNGKNILMIDPDYQPMNFSYTLIDEITGEQKIGQIQNGHFYIIPEKAPFKRFIMPMNKEQKFFVNAMEEGYANIMVIDAKAGSGKSLLSIGTAMNLVKKKEYSNIIYIRNSIESLDKGEDVGYLPGMEEKFAIYNHPLMDSLKYIASSEIKSSNKNKSKANEIQDDDEAISTKVQNYIKNYGIDTMWPGEMRGRTISNAVVIVDECITGDQILHTEKYGTKTIKEILELYLKEDVKVLSYNFETNEQEYKSIENIKHRIPNQKLYKLKLDNGDTIKVTGNHKLYVNGKYQTIEDILINGDRDLMSKY